LGCFACGTLLPEENGSASPGPFESFGITPVYAIDRQELRRRLLRFSRLTHPDFFATAGAEARSRAERATSQLNSAFETLSDDASRADHLIRSLGGPDEEEERAMPDEFLMEVLEWNELLEGARRGDALPQDRVTGLRSELESRRAEALETVAGLLEPLPARGSDALRRARRALNVLRYLDRALEQLESLRLSRAEAR